MRGATETHAMTETEALIQKTPGVIGGDACIRRTRIPVWLLVAYRELGRSDADLLDDYPGLTQTDLDSAWGYYAANPDEIRAAIRRQDEA